MNGESRPRRRLETHGVEAKLRRGCLRDRKASLRRWSRPRAQSECVAAGQPMNERETAICLGRNVRRNTGQCDRDQNCTMDPHRRARSKESNVVVERWSVVTLHRTTASSHSTSHNLSADESNASPTRGLQRGAASLPQYMRDGADRGDCESIEHRQVHDDDRDLLQTLGNAASRCGRESFEYS